VSSETESFVGERAGLGEDLLHLAAFRTLVLERVHDLIAVLDLEGRVVVASPSWTRLGWEPDELVGQPMLDLLHPEDLERGATALGSALSGASVDTVLVRLRRRDGGWFSIDASGAPIRDAAGEVACVLGIGRDVSEREELRQRVTEVDALYRIAEAISRATALDELFEEAIDTLVAATGADHAAILLYDDADVLRFRAWRGLSDAFRAAAAGHAPWPQDAEEPEPVLVADVTEGGFSPELERAVRAEGIAALAFVPLVHGRRLLGTFVLYHDQPHRWQEREVRLCLTIATHLASATIRTRARNALRASREQLETILRTVDEGIVVQARDGRLVYANAAAARLIGFQTAEELLAAEPQDVLSRFELFDERGEPLEASSLPSRRAFDGESAELLTLYRRLGGDERRWSVIRANPVRSDTGEVELVVSVIHDVTAPKRAEEEAAASVRRVRFLARASELLSETLRYEETLGALARLAVPGFAGHVTVDLYEDGVLRCVAARHVDPEKTSRSSRADERWARSRSEPCRRSPTSLRRTSSSRASSGAVPRSRSTMHSSSRRRASGPTRQRRSSSSTTACSSSTATRSSGCGTRRPRRRCASGRRRRSAATSPR
jgi:PAS domain S-box-containing protein